MGACQSKEAKLAVVKSHADTPPAADLGANNATGKCSSSGRSELAAHMIRERKRANVWDCKS